MKTVIEMAREAGLLVIGTADGSEAVYTWPQGITDELERFADLVADAKEAEHKEAMRWDIHSCGPTCKRYACVARREAVAAEREACARICETEWSTTQEHVHGLALADMIRARGNT